jgi:hypothetical protein
VGVMDDVESAEDFYTRVYREMVQRRTCGGELAPGRQQQPRHRRQSSHVDDNAHHEHGGHKGGGERGGARNWEYDQRRQRTDGRAEGREYAGQYTEGGYALGSHGHGHSRHPHIDERNHEADERPTGRYPRAVVEPLSRGDHVRARSRSRTRSPDAETRRRSRGDSPPPSHCHATLHAQHQNHDQRTRRDDVDLYKNSGGGDGAVHFYRTLEFLSGEVPLIIPNKSEPQLPPHLVAEAELMLRRLNENLARGGSNAVVERRPQR